MDITQSTSYSDGRREFYAPATFQFSTAPGRVERLVSSLFRQRGAMHGRPRVTIPVPEFYAPATFQFSTRPGRVERVVSATFRQRGAMDGRPPADEREYAFYAPATTEDGVARRGRRPSAR